MSLTNQLPPSQFLTPRQLRGLLRTGDVVLPGDSRLPKFSQTPFIADVDKIVGPLPADQLKDLGALLGVLALLPRFMINLMLRVSEDHERFPNFLGTQLRLLNTGLKAILFSLYYSDFDHPDSRVAGAIYRQIGWDAQIATPLPADKQMAGYAAQDPGMRPVEAPSLQEPGPEDVAAIYRVAAQAQEQLRRLPMASRVGLIQALQRQILSKRDKLVAAIVKDTRKSRTDALVSEVFGALDQLVFLQKQAPKMLKDRKVHTPIFMLGKKSQVFFEPLGTVLVISPWNYPFTQAIGPIATAILTGNAVVYKPSEYTPLTGVLEELFRDAGWPDHWVQVVYGDGATGAALIDQRPDKIFFTGSGATGEKILAQAARHLIPVELELGGKDPMIVFEDAQIDRAVAGALWGGLTNSGQSCTSVERLYVQESIFATFRHRIQASARRLKLCDGDHNGEIGAMTNAEQVAIVKAHLDDALEKGATLLTGQNWDGKNPFIPPLILDNVHAQMLCMQQETFGPIIPLVPFYEEQEVVQMANASEYGLSASVWTADKQRADRVARSLQVGNVSINNVMLTEGNPALPFGGSKKSGFGRHKGEFGLYGFTNIKAVLKDANSKKIEANWYPYGEKKYQLFDRLTLAAFAGGMSALVKIAVNGLRLESHAAKAKIGE